MNIKTRPAMSERTEFYSHTSFCLLLSPVHILILFKVRPSLSKFNLPQSCQKTSNEKPPVFVVTLTWNQISASNPFPLLTLIVRLTLLVHIFPLHATGISQESSSDRSCSVDLCACAEWLSLTLQSPRLIANPPNGSAEFKTWLKRFIRLCCWLRLSDEIATKNLLFLSLHKQFLLNFD